MGRAQTPLALFPHIKDKRSRLSEISFDPFGAVTPNATGLIAKLWTETPDLRRTFKKAKVVRMSERKKTHIFVFYTCGANKEIQTLEMCL